MNFNEEKYLQKKNRNFDGVANSHIEFIKLKCKFLFVKKVDWIFFFGKFLMH